MSYLVSSLIVAVAVAVVGRLEENTIATERERKSLFCAEPIKQLCVQASSVAVGRSHNNDHENANEILREHTVDGAAEKKETTTTTRDWEKIRIRQRKKGRMEEEKGA